MNLSRYVVISHETSPKFTAADFDDIFEVFSIPVNENSESFQYDGALVKQFIFSRHSNKQSLAIPVIFDFLNLLDIDTESADFGTSVRQLIAIGYFMPQLIRSNHYQFLEAMITTFKKMINEIEINKKFMHQYSTSLTFVLSKLTKRMIDVDISEERYATYQNLIDLSLQLFSIEKIATEKEVSKVLSFFFNCLYTFRGKCEFTNEQNQIFINLLTFLKKFMNLSKKCNINYMDLLRHALKLMIEKPLNLICRKELLSFIVSLSLISRDVTTYIFDPKNAAFLVIYIEASLKMIEFNLDQEKIIPQQEKEKEAYEKDVEFGQDIDEMELDEERKNFNKKLTNQFKIIQEKINRTFQEDFPAFSDIERKKFSERYEIVLKTPDYVEDNKDLCELLQSIKTLCEVGSKETQATINTNFMKGVLYRKLLHQLPIYPFFLFTWLNNFVLFNPAPIASELHKMNFFTVTLNCAFNMYTDQSLRDFIINLTILMTEKYMLRDPFFLSDFMTFLFSKIEELDVDQQLLDGLAKCAGKSPTTFVRAAQKCNFAEKMAEYLAELMYRHHLDVKNAVNAKPDENIHKVIETRTQLLKFIDRIDSFPLVFQYLFECKLFSQVILSHFYDDSTVNFSACQLLFIFQQFSRKSPVMAIIVKFFESFEINDHLITILLNCSSSGYEINPFEISKLFSETNFLDFLVQASRKLNSNDTFYGLVDLFTKMTTNPEYPINFDVFLRISDLVPKDFDISNLWKIVFEDNKNDSEPRIIKNPAPISLIYILKEKSGEIVEFVKFLTECISFDENVKYSLSALDLSSLLLQKINEYRTKVESDDVFNVIFDLFYSLSLCSLKSKDFCSLFRLCASLPDHKRPFFTMKIIELMNNLFIKRKNIPTSFFDLSGVNSHIQLPEIPLDLINTKGFSLYFDIIFTTDDFNGKLLEFSSPNSKITLEWKNKKFSLFLKDNEIIHEVEWEEPLQTNCWTSIGIIFTPQQFEVIQNCDSRNTEVKPNRSYITQYKKITFKSSFIHFQAFHNVPCKVCRILCPKEGLGRELIKSYNLLPKTKAVSFHPSEQKGFIAYFKPLFTSDVASQILYAFHATSISGKFAINTVSSQTLRVTGSVYNTEPEPTYLLDLLGGVQAVLPFFGQLDQEIISGKPIERDFLIKLFQLLTSIFRSDELTFVQRSFRNINGPSILAFLISISSLKNVEHDEIIDILCEFVDSIKFVPLVLQVIDHILFNFKLWLYLPLEFQTKAYMKFYNTIFQRITAKNASTAFLKGFGISKLLMLMRVYLWDHNSNRNICLVDEPKMDILNKNIEGQRPVDCSSIRNNFWAIIKQMTDLFLTEEDISLLISFCCETLDLEFSKEAISLFIYLLKRKNHKIIQYLQKDYAFSTFYDLLRVPNSLTQNRVLQIYVLLDPNFLKPFSMQDWDAGIISTIAYQTIDEEFVRILEKAIIKPMKESVTSREPVKWVLAQSHLIPLFLMAIQQISEEKKLESFDKLTTLILSTYEHNPDDISKHWDHSFLLLLMAQMPTPDSPITPLCEKCINFLIAMYIKATTILMSQLKSNSLLTPSKSKSQLIKQQQKKSTNKDDTNKELEQTQSKSEKKFYEFFTFSNLIYLLSFKSKHDYLHIIRVIYEYFLKTEDIRIKPTSTLTARAYYKIYTQVIQFVYMVPAIDLDNNDTMYCFQDLFKIYLIQGSSAPHFHYTVNVNKNEQKEILKWNDVNVAKLLIRAIMDRSESMIELNTQEIKPLNWVGTLIKIGVQIPAYMNEFLNIADDFLEFILKHSDHLKPYRRALSEVFTGLVKAHEKNPSVTSNFIYTNSILFADILLKNFKVMVPESAPAAEFETNISFLHPFIERSRQLKEKNMKRFDDFKAKRKSMILDLASEAIGMAPLTRKLKKGEMSEEVSLRTTLEQFALSRKQQDTSSIKRYKKIFRALSSENGPWQTVEVDHEAHRKLKNRITRFCRFFMKPNFNFDDHKTASIARDIGNVQNAQEIYQKEFAKLKLTPFKGDLALVVADRKKLRDFNTSNEKVILKLDCTWVTMEQNYSGTLSMIKGTLIFDSPTKFVRIPLQNITKVFQRHYLLLSTAVEIFTTVKKSYFFDFSENEQRQLFLKVINEFKTQNIKFIQLNQEDIQQLIKNASEKWCSGQMSNFDYLLKINKYAGRSYHDLSQYPVFPWILQDYESEKLDLNDVKVYRNLSKPIGTFSKTRLEILKEHLDATFKNDPDSHYLYGAFYSSAAVVIGYLIRMEPFTSLHVTLQSQRFDHADRLFVNIPAAWESVTNSSMDFRELIPEFFYFPDFLVNENKLDLGVLVKTGEVVGDVTLPKWAKSPLDFVTKNRAALESPYVTANLHKWINLIFGPKSRPPLSEKYNNLFHPFYYETAAHGRTGKNLEMVREYAACFGEAPLQIFDQKPPRRHFSPKPLISCLSAANMKIKEVFTNPIIAMSTSSGRISTIDSEFNFYSDAGLKGTLGMHSPPELEDVREKGMRSAVCSHAAIIALPWDSALYYFKLDNKTAMHKKLEPFIIDRQHNTAITAIAMNDSFVATGSMDSTLRIWEAKDMKQINVIAKHKTEITEIAINQKQRICVSISADGFLMVTSLVNGDYINGIKLTFSGEPKSISISDFGEIIVGMNGTLNESKLIVLDQNLRQVCEKSFETAIIKTDAIEWVDGMNYVAAAMRDSEIHILKLPFLEEVNKNIAVNYEVVTLEYMKEYKSLVVGDDEGKIRSYRINKD
ncbi:hypothetical protein TRFO_33100 [Tritrichomonas foetus]|uniref:Beige/BEACH domain containing protein n=1 Tax=Tritrichomonas foetus TaxID=1144522 RepID=A0A1J4JSK5_9EUKA|nr:hypothetical protein TRFO_33100 [Tritrichomonas foetus]|eukprot:OHT00229.1 hypothetical protein TRFO_33100 [Tritrichomonas foetus]